MMAQNMHNDLLLIKKGQEDRGGGRIHFFDLK